MEKNTSRHSKIELVMYGIMTVSLIAMVVLVFINAVLRYFFNTGYPVGEEFSRYFFVWAVFLGTAAAFKDNQHVGVTLVIDKLKGAPRLFMDILGTAAMLIALGIMLVGGIFYTIEVVPSEGPATGISFAWISISFVISTAAMIVLVLGDAYRKFIRK
ncbi:MAG: TRAP transporter small permease [Bacillota bacterium]